MAAAGHPRNFARGSARSPPAHPKLLRASVFPPRSRQPSVPNAPARNIAKRSNTIPASSRCRAEACGASAFAIWSESSDLSLLIDGDHRLRIHASTGDEVFAEPCFGERPPVGRVLEDFLDVVAIPSINELAGRCCVIEDCRRPVALGDEPDVAPRAG